MKTEAQEGSSEDRRLRLPAEWEPHRATWLSWPHEAETWPGIWDRVPDVWAEMIRTLRRHESVCVLVPDDSLARRIPKSFDLGEGHDVEFFSIPTNDAWIRDYGPLVCIDESCPTGARGRRVAVSFRFDSWGEKYPSELDDAAGREVADWMDVLSRDAGEPGVPRREIDRVLEGGSIDVDGAGRLLTTDACLLGAGRHPDLDRARGETMLRESLGIGEVIWLGDGIIGDDTDGHVDDMTRFVATNTVVTAIESDESDANFRALRENRERLESYRDARGSKLEILEIPMPRPVLHGDLRCPASHANFYIGNGSVLVPTFGGRSDDVALEIIAHVFHDREVVGIDCTDVVLGLGALHCVTMQEPADGPPASPNDGGGPEEPEP